MHWHRRFSHDELAFHVGITPHFWFVARNRNARGSVGYRAHKSSHSPDGTVQIIRRSTSEKSLGGDYSKGRFKQRLGRGTTTGCKRIRQRSHYWTIRTATIEAKSQGRPPVRLAETFVHCTECNIRQPSPAPQATEFGYPSIQTRMQIEREAKHDR